MHSVWFSRDFIGVVSFLRARRSGKTQKHLHNNKLCGYFFQARSKLHRFSKYFHSRYQTLAINFDTLFHFPVNLCWRPCWIFCVSIWHCQFRSTFNKKPIWCTFSQLPGTFMLASVLNFCISSASKISFLWGATTLQHIATYNHGERPQAARSC